jgi:ribosome-associated translation inhibitor RaiA
VVVRFLADGGDNCCQIELALRPQKIKIEGSHADPFAAVNHAAERISISVARALERERDNDWRVVGGRVPKTI